MAENTKTKGNISEAKALFEFQRFHIPVCLPWGDNERYDMVAEFNGKLNRIQIKTANEEENGSIICKCVSSSDCKRYIGETDYFIFYNQKRDLVALVPMKEIKNNTQISLRIEPPKNGQKEKIRFFSDFSFEKTLGFLAPEVETFVKNKYYCIDCGTEIVQKSTRCSSCEAKRRIIPLEKMPVDRQTLKNLIRTTPFLQIGTKFAVTDNAIRKWCDKFNLPRTKKEINSYSDEEWEKI